MMEAAIKSILEANGAVVAFSDSITPWTKSPFEPSDDGYVYEMGQDVHNDENALILKTAKSSFSRTSFVVHCLSKNYDTARAMARAVRSAMHGISGLHAGYQISLIIATTTDDDFIPTTVTMTGNPKGLTDEVVNFEAVYNEP